MEDKEILKIMYRPLLAWICGLSVFYLIIPASIYFVQIDKLGDLLSSKSDFSKLFFGNFNKKIFTYWLAGAIAATCIATSILMWWVTGGKGAFLDKFQLHIFISLCILLISIYIFTTGGFIDSPYSGVLSLYVANFFVMQGKHYFLNFKIFILSYTVILVTLPYIVLPLIFKNENIYL